LCVALCTALGAMKSSIRMLRSAAIVLGLPVAQAALTESSIVYLDPSPYALKVHEAERTTLEDTIASLGPNRAKWEAQNVSRLSYVVKQHSDGLLIPDPCSELPIHVEIRGTHLISATYAATGGRCLMGEPVKRGPKHPEGQYLMPNEIFNKAEDAKDQLRCYLPDATIGCLPTALRVTFEEKLGLSIKMEDYSELVSDYYWSLEISRIEVAP